MNLETRQRAFSEWWTEETDYLFQRIERWAACARGYNRLRPQKSSRDEINMKESSASRWSIAGNKLFIEEFSFNPRLQPLNRSHASQSQHEELKLNCCGTLNYRSNGKLDSKCLETYSYDHSIYFKTIGDLKKTRNPELGNEDLNQSKLEPTNRSKKFQIDKRGFEKSGEFNSRKSNEFDAKKNNESDSRKSNEFDGKKDNELDFDKGNNEFDPRKDTEFDSRKNKEFNFTVKTEFDFGKSNGFESRESDEFDSRKNDDFVKKSNEFYEKVFEHGKSKESDPRRKMNRMTFLESFSEEEAEDYPRTFCYPKVDFRNLSTDDVDQNANFERNQIRENPNLSQSQELEQIEDQEPGEIQVLGENKDLSESQNESESQSQNESQTQSESQNQNESQTQSESQNQNESQNQSENQNEIETQNQCLRQSQENDQKFGFSVTIKDSFENSTDHLDLENSNILEGTLKTSENQIKKYFGDF